MLIIVYLAFEERNKWQFDNIHIGNLLEIKYNNYKKLLSENLYKHKNVGEDAYMELLICIIIFYAVVKFANGIGRNIEQDERNKRVEELKKKREGKYYVPPEKRK